MQIAQLLLFVLEIYQVQFCSINYTTNLFKHIWMYIEVEVDYLCSLLNFYLKMHCTNLLDQGFSTGHKFTP